MFKYTREALSVIIEDIKRYCKFFKFGSLIFSLVYFTYAIISGTGFLIANIVLLSLLGVYTLFEIITSNKNIKYVKRYVKRSYKWTNIIIKAFTLGSMLYSIYSATTKVSAISIIIITLMIVLWVVQLLLEIAAEIIENKADLLVNAYNQDIKDLKDTVKKPVTMISNGFKKLMGKDIEPKEEKSKIIQKLDKRIEEKLEEKNNSKEA